MQEKAELQLSDVDERRIIAAGSNYINTVLFTISKELHDERLNNIKQVANNIAVTCKNTKLHTRLDFGMLMSQLTRLNSELHQWRSDKAIHYSSVTSAIDDIKTLDPFVSFKERACQLVSLIESMGRIVNKDQLARLHSNASSLIERCDNEPSISIDALTALFDSLIENLTTVWLPNLLIAPVDSDAFLLYCTSRAKEKRNQEMKRLTEEGLFFKPESHRYDMKHAYGRATAPEFLLDVSQEVAETQEDRIRLALQAMILSAEQDINDARLSSDPVSKGVHVTRRAYGATNNHFLIEKISGAAPHHGGTKRLLSVTTPSGMQCVVGVRTMGSHESYCCYPLAKPDADADNWVVYPPDLIRVIYENSELTASATGMHLTTPAIKPRALTLACLDRNRRPGMTYVSNGSHCTLDISIRVKAESDLFNHRDSTQGIGDQNTQNRKSQKIRLVFNPRVETSVNVDQSTICVRAGRLYLIPLIERGKFSEIPPNSSLRDLPRITRREVGNGFLSSCTSASSVEAEVGYTNTISFIETALRCDMFQGSQAVLAEITTIGRILQQKLDNLTNVDDDTLIRMYRSITVPELRIAEQNSVTDREPKPPLGSPMSAIIKSIFKDPQRPSSTDDGTLAACARPNIN